MIGAACARLWFNQGNYIIGSDIQQNSIFGNCNEYVPMDLGASDAQEMFLKIPEVDYFLHAGGISGFMVETDNPQRIFDVNVAGSVAALRYAQRVGCRRIVLCSSVMVYGPTTEPHREIDESEYPEPITVYGGSKLAIEGLMQGWVGQHGVDAVALRFTHVYGPGRTTECFIREMLTAAAEGRACHIPQASGSLRQYVHIEDICQAIDRAMRVASPRSRVFNISADELHTLAEVAEVVRQVTGRPLEISFDETRDMPNYRIGKLSIRRAREELGYAPRLTLAEGIKEYWTTAFQKASAAQ